ncbi:hypothetical protein [Deinococcus peraridilitoris]|uniref:Uncharacterized protein n=1 Tax=Deinococcus peraridilitoris (strain DSM 19664 / LMG 22246 / CIP 109416 / KR-200) TaxID=937777 RepID=K9ZXQ6_DEIPD|nr:hypothetical protein [Deinococcus peraridilitoris]AFZ65979.1 hypothetical protein Deipe_0379 [Deinococcus peraridilitoris DSM 19664]
MNDSQCQARRAIEAAFRETAERDIELIAEQECRERGIDEAAKRCRSSDALISDMIWSRFGEFDWLDVAYVYDGTYGHSSRFLWAKVDLTVAWAMAEGQLTPEVEAALLRAVKRLRDLWIEWAGWKATTSDDLAVALRE